MKSPKTAATSPFYLANKLFSIIGIYKLFKRFSDLC